MVGIIEAPGITGKQEAPRPERTLAQQAVIYVSHVVSSLGSREDLAAVAHDALIGSVVGYAGKSSLEIRAMDPQDIMATLQRTALTDERAFYFASDFVRRLNAYGLANPGVINLADIQPVEYDALLNRAETIDEISPAYLSGAKEIFSQIINRVPQVLRALHPKRKQVLAISSEKIRLVEDMGALGIYADIILSELMVPSDPAVVSAISDHFQFEHVFAPGVSVRRNDEITVVSPALTVPESEMILEEGHPARDWIAEQQQEHGKPVALILEPNEYDIVIGERREARRVRNIGITYFYRDNYGRLTKTSINLPLGPRPSLVA